MTSAYSEGSGERDEDLLARMAEGDREAFAEVFSRHHAMVHRFARQMGGAQDMADDVTQDVFLALLDGGARFDPRLGTLSTYLYGIARNLVRRRFSRGGARTEVGISRLEEGAERALVSWTDPGADLQRDRALAALRRALSELPFRCREVVVLCDLHELSYGEAARIVGCPVGTIRSRLSRARGALIDRCRDILVPGASVHRAHPGRPRVVGVDVR